MRFRAPPTSSGQTSREPNRDHREPVAILADSTHLDVMTLAGFSRISVDPQVCGGRPVVTGTRVRVSDVLEMLAGGATPAEIAADYPYLSEDDARAVLAYAAAQADHPVVFAVE